jgi:hypothetical protein
MVQPFFNRYKIALIYLFLILLRITKGIRNTDEIGYDLFL